MGRRAITLEVPEGLSVTTVRVGGEELAVLSFPLPSPALDGRLSAAERVVVGRIVAGDSNAEIARARNTSARTVANQIAAIFRKLGVGSRRELVSALGRRDAR